MHRDADEGPRPGLGGREPAAARPTPSPRSGADGAAARCARARTFDARFRRSPRAKREVSEDVDAGGPRDHRGRRGARRRGADRLYAAASTGSTSTPATLRVAAAEIDAAVGRCPPEALDALKLARDRIEAYHARQRPQECATTDALGVTLGWRWTAVESVGLYVPGGTASYPSSVLMNAVRPRSPACRGSPWRCRRREGELNPLVLAAARLAGVDEIYRVGGAQAVAALAYGTATIAPVAKIVGPGNAYVAAAKRRVFGTGRHRHDRRPVRGADPRRRRRQPGLDRRRPARPGRARRGRAGDPDHRQRRPRRRGRGGGRAPARDAAAGRDRRARAGAISARSSSSSGLEDAVPLVDRLAPEHLEIETARSGGARGARSATPARSSSAAIRPRRSATMSAVRTTSCRRRARPASPRASASSTS